MAETQSLLSMIETAETGSRAIDRAIWTALEFDHDGEPSHAPAYSTSLDAAEAFAARALPGWWWTTGRCGLTCHASVGPDRAFVAEPALSKYDAGFHADLPNPSTPALALCAAILRARLREQVSG